MSIQHRLDFARVDIEPKADDQLLLTTDYEETPIFEPSAVARVEPSFPIDSGGCFLGGAISWTCGRREMDGKGSAGELPPRAHLPIILACGLVNQPVPINLVE